MKKRKRNKYLKEGIKIRNPLLILTYNKPIINNHTSLKSMIILYTFSKTTNKCIEYTR